MISTKRVSFDEGLLTIKHVLTIDKGDYLCEASNSQGRIVRTITLMLTGNNKNICIYSGNTFFPL